MTLRFTNTLTRKLEDFVPLKAGEVRMYCCGPTVYNYVHIGNLRNAVFNDLLRRYLKYRGYKVVHVMNITDVDDKTIKRARTEQKKLSEITEFYTKAFFEDLEALNVERPEITPRATEEIAPMVDLIQRLLDKGYAYRAAGGDIYFRISKLDNYYELAHLDRSTLVQGGSGRTNRTDEYTKEDASDFALWKAYDAADGDVFWDVPIGKGRPGWHIECSAMSAKYLGQPFDIHTGGEDLIFPHHTNEIAQSEAANRVKLAAFWLHNAYLLVDGRKMSKSLNNFYTLRDLLAKKLDPRAIRYELLKVHYRSPLDFRLEDFEANSKILERLDDLVAGLGQPKAGAGWGDCASAVTAAEQAFSAALDNDLNISEALAALFEFMNAVNRNSDALSQTNADAVLAALKKFDSVLGVIFPKAQALDAAAQSLIDEREAARKAKNFARADELRRELEKMGIIIKDTAKGTVWRKAP
jgi:cysteinyl-tRNA synthetase